jgi:4-amino-4-deoxy-L-arabinose transferase-like glycosyltransferase
VRSLAPGPYHPRVPDDRSQRPYWSPPRAWGPLLLLLAATAYLYGLDGFHIPKIGDEAPYFEITRTTAESGRWLPLRAEDAALVNTKPPLLFWLGIAATEGGRVWSLWRLRLPIVAVTFLVAGVVFLLTRRLARVQGTAAGAPWVATLSFLGFWSTFQYGRPFLTNLPETLFVFSAFALALACPRRLEGWALWVAIGLLGGLACLVKSFALVLPVGFAFAWWRLAGRGWRPGPFLRRDVPRLLISGLIALGAFALWPLLDGDPRAVVDAFVLGENVGKLDKGAGWRGLVSGPYPVWNVWLGPFRNAGLLALPLLALVVSSIRGRRALPPAEKALWILVLAFLVTYTVPGQRQANYLLPIMPALAVLLGLRWPLLGGRWLLLATVPAGVAAGAMLAVAGGLAARGILPASAWAPWQLAVPALALLLALLLLVRRDLVRGALHPLALLVLLSLGCVAAPFEGPRGRFDDATVAAVRGKVVHVRSHFRSRWERHRFLLPGADVRGYHAWDEGQFRDLVEAGEIVSVNRALGEAVGDSFEVLGERLDVRTRQTDEQIRQLVFGLRLEHLVWREILVRPRDE